ncbi:MAG: putative Ig domain-containing protein [Bacteroidales bacterium]|nr:putative Ig domain-containing protein [Bacteroidales bacterium]
MKNLLCLLALGITLSLQAQTPKGESINLNQKWRFIQGDNIAYAKPGFDDAGWKTIQTDRTWEESGYEKYDGYAWFRIKVIIPLKLKQSAFLKDSLRIYLGKIDDFDQVFLNGSLIGINGKNVSARTVPDTMFKAGTQSYWDVERPYSISASDPRIKWDQENVIAVRVFDWNGGGGMYSGDQAITMIKVSDYLAIENNISPYKFVNDNLKKTINLRNTSASYTIEGDFSIRAINKLTGEEIYKNEILNIALKPFQKQVLDIQIKKPDQSALITYSFDFTKAGTKIYVTDETPYITTPLPSALPRINGASVTAARPGKPFLFTIPASGDRPMTFEALNLPKGLNLDPNSGIISGKVDLKGEYKVVLKAKNEKGVDSRELTISIGDRICLTPPMGWNSWNCWGLAVDEQKVIASAHTYLNKGLMNHGWTYVNIDDGWEIRGDLNPKRDPEGNILTNEKFPDMKRLGDSIHALGLKFGIYSSPGPLTCGGYTASYQHEEQDARSYASWGIDYLKYDWCSYGNIAKDATLAEYKKPYFVMRDALNKVDRDIVYSLCQYGMGDVWKWGDEVGGNLWRTTGDITDTWESLREIGFGQVKNQPYAKPGNWNDPDMLIVGWVGWGPSLHPTRLTPDEQYTHISLWCLLSAPLLIGCDLQRLDEFTLNLLTNDEVIALNQDPLGSQAKQTLVDGDIQVWVKEMADGSKAFGVFNLGGKTANFILEPEKAGLKPGGELRDLWRQKSMGKAGNLISVAIPSHGVMLYKLK